MHLERYIWDRTDQCAPMRITFLPFSRIHLLKLFRVLTVFYSRNCYTDITPASFKGNHTDLFIFIIY